MFEKQERKRIGWFPVVILLLSLVKLCMLHGLVIYPIPGAACDDALMTDWASNIAGGRWTGPFTNYIFMKEVGFAFYLAIICRLHLPYILTTNLLYLIGCLILLYAVSHVIKQKWALCLIYAVTLFHPIMTAVESGQRVYRNGFATALTLWVFGSLLNLYFEMEHKTFCRNLVWALLAAGSLGMLWETKSDTIWLLPFTVVVMAVTAVLLIKKRKEARLFPKLILVAFPFLGILFFSQAVDLLNSATYGSTGIAYYGPAMDILTGVEAEDDLENVSLSRETFQKLCELSPTLATTKTKVEDAMDKYDEDDTHPGDGNVEDGWIGWALIKGFEKAGCYEDCQTTNEFYRKVYEELNEAVEKGEIKLAQKSVLDSYHLANQKEGKELLGTIGEAWRFVASHRYMFSDICELEGDNIAGSQRFERITHNHAYYGMFDSDYYCVGWVAYPGRDLRNMDVYIEDAEGNQFLQLEFEKSIDVKQKYPEAGGAERCRFFAEWNCDGKEVSDFYITAYEGKEQVAKARITETGLQDVSSDICVGSVDGFFLQGGQQAIRKEAQKAADRCNAVYEAYHFFGSILAWTGVAAYLIFTLLSLLEWKNKRYDTVDSWLVITGIKLSILVLFLGVAVTHLEKCPAISYMYLSAAYPLFNLVAMMSIVKCVETVMQFWDRRKSITYGGS